MSGKVAGAKKAPQDAGKAAGIGVGGVGHC